MLLNLVYACIYGNYSTLGAVINGLTIKYDYSPSEIGICVAGMISSGIVGSFVFGSMIDKYQKYVLFLRIVCVCSTFMMTGIFFTLPYNNLYLFMANIVGLGFFLIPIIPVSWGLSTELTYPCPESISLGMMIAASQVWATILGLVASILIDHNPLYGIGLFFSLSCIGTFFTIFMREDLRR
jgi:MFS family permease